MLGLSPEARAQLGILGRDPDRARVQVAGAHHHAAGRDQRRRREAHLVRAEQRRDDDVAARLQLPVGLHPDARAEVVRDERLLRLGEPELPGHARVQDRGERRGAGAAVVARDQDVVGVRLRDARRDGADADLGDELDRDPRLRVRAAEVVDQLLQVLDRVDVVVRRRRDQPDAGRGQPHRRDVRVDLVPGQLPALARLRALRHLDLQLVGVREVLDRDPEAARGDLLDLRAALVAVADGVLAALARVRAAADPVHRDGERLVRLPRERPERHRSGREALDDLGGGLDLVERDAAVGALAQPQQAAQRRAARRLGVDLGRVLLVGLPAAGPHRVLEQRDRLRVPLVVLAARAPGVEPDHRQQLVRRPGVGARVARERVLGDRPDADAADPRGGAGEVPLDELRREADRLEDLRAAVGRHRRDAHLRHRLQQALGDPLDRPALRLLGGHPRRAGGRPRRAGRASRASGTG